MTPLSINVAEQIAWRLASDAANRKRDLRNRLGAITNKDRPATAPTPPLGTHRASNGVTLADRA